MNNPPKPLSNPKQMDHQAKKLKVMDQLVEGRKLATQVQQFLSQPESGLSLAEDLMAKILGTFNNTISVLESCEFNSSSSSLAAVEVSQNASCDNNGKVENSVDSREKLGPVKSKRGCYKRKKRSETWKIKSPRLEDAFSWRKYGQKQILNAKFPRGYFRCTHKYTQGCKATKQVQMIDLEPKMYNITYIGNHTCNANEETIPKIQQTCDHHDEITMDSEEHKSPSLTTSMKEEELENQNHGSSNENDLSLVWPEMVFEEDHHHHHQAIYVSGGTSTTISVLSSQDLMVFGDGPEFGFSDNEQFSIFN